MSGKVNFVTISVLLPQGIDFFLIWHISCSPWSIMHRNKNRILIALTLLLLVIAPLRADKPPQVKQVGTEAVPTEKLVLGAAEYAAIPALNAVFPARIDTGAKRSSINAVDVEAFERDGNRWVKATILNPATDAEFPLEMEVSRTARIKKEGEESIRRHSVELVVVIGDITKQLDVNLADRSNLEYPLLIGRDFLRGAAIVDVAKEFTQKTPGAPARKKKTSK